MHVLYAYAPRHVLGEHIINRSPPKLVPQHSAHAVVAYLVDVHALGPQIRPRKINLLHEFCVCLGYIVEREDAVPELEKEVGTEGDKSPERQLGNKLAKNRLTFGKPQ